MLESNLHRFSATWQSAVASAASVIGEEKPIHNLPLSPADYGALVDVVDALISQLPEVTVARLFGVFLQLLQQSAEGLARQQSSRKPEPKGSLGGRRLKGILGSSAPLSAAETSRQTLQCLLRRALKGLKHICERIEKSIRNKEMHEVYEEFRNPEKLFEVWKVRYKK